MQFLLGKPAEEEGVWQDREIRFDTTPSLLNVRPGEVMIDSIDSVEDTKGNNGEKGSLAITNLRLIWTCARNSRINLSIGYNAVLSVNIRTANSRLRGNTQVGATPRAVGDGWLCRHAPELPHDRPLPATSPTPSTTNRTHPPHSDCPCTFDVPTAHWPTRAQSLAAGAVRNDKVQQFTVRICLHQPGARVAAPLHDGSGRVPRL